MKIKEGLIFDKIRGEFIGHTKMGEIIDHLSCSKNQVATQCLTIMVRGIFTKLNFPFASFPVKKLGGNQMVSILMEATFRLEKLGFKVVAQTLDGSRRYFRLIGSNE